MYLEPGPELYVDAGYQIKRVRLLRTVMPRQVRRTPITEPSTRTWSDVFYNIWPQRHCQGRIILQLIMKLFILETEVIFPRASPSQSNQPDSDRINRR